MFRETDYYNEVAIRETKENQVEKKKEKKYISPLDYSLYDIENTSLASLKEQNKN